MEKNNVFANKVKDTGRENIFANAKITGYIDISPFNLDPQYEYCILPIEGNCLDHELSPIRIKNGDAVAIHEIPLDDISILSTIGKVVCFALSSGGRYVKEAVSYNGIVNSITVRMFNPEVKYYEIPISMIKALFVVDKVLKAEWFE